MVTTPILRERASAEYARIKNLLANEFATETDRISTASYGSFMVENLTKMHQRGYRVDTIAKNCLQGSIEMSKNLDPLSQFNNLLVLRQLCAFSIEAKESYKPFTRTEKMSELIVGFLKALFGRFGYKTPLEKAREALDKLDGQLDAKAAGVAQSTAYEEADLKKSQKGRIESRETLINHAIGWAIYNEQSLVKAQRNRFPLNFTSNTVSRAL